MKHYIMSVDVVVMDDAVTLDEEQVRSEFFKVANAFKKENGDTACYGIANVKVTERPIIPENDPVVVPIRKTV
jgi:hypothetical protein